MVPIFTSPKIAREKIKTELLKMLADDFTKDYQAGVINIATYINCQKKLNSIIPSPKSDESASKKLTLLQKLISHKRWDKETFMGKVNSCSFFSSKSPSCPSGIQKLRLLPKIMQPELFSERISQIANDRLTKLLVTRSGATEDFYKLLTHANDPEISDKMMIKALEAFAAKHNFSLTEVNLGNQSTAIQESSTPRIVL